MTVKYRTDGMADLQDSIVPRATTGTVGKSGNRLADGVLSGYAWEGTTITYAFPDKKNDYGYDREPHKGFDNVSARLELIASRILDQEVGTAADDAFSVEGLTNVTLTRGGDKTANIRYAESKAADPTAYAFYPHGGERAGDIWFGTNPAYELPKVGNYAYATVLHETGHALGLKHGHDSVKFDKIHATLPARYDSLEYSVMTYHSFVGQKSHGGYTNEMFGFPQTYMMADILALQHMYGADFTTNDGDTVYSWSQASGQTLINGDVGLNPGENRIFATIWDGGGTDTYDLSAYRKGVQIDLAPGYSSKFKTSQLADLNQWQGGKTASGSIYNALLFEGDQRSLIENAIGGSGNDRFKGNVGDNTFTGGAGLDQFVFTTGGGNDTITDFTFGDRINLVQSGLDFTEVVALASDAGANVVFDFGGGNTLTVLNFHVADLVPDNFILA